MNHYHITGNLLYIDADIICQQVNCQGVMGAGLAKAIREKWPVVYSEYKKLCDSKTPEELLGKIQLIRVEPNKYVLNIFGQLGYGRDKVYTDYSALEEAFKSIEKDFKDYTIAMPELLGCGLAGGDPVKVKELAYANIKTPKVYHVTLLK